MPTEMMDKALAGRRVQVGELRVRCEAARVKGKGPSDDGPAHGFRLIVLVLRAT